MSGIRTDSGALQGLWYASGARRFASSLGAVSFQTIDRRPAGHGAQQLCVSALPPIVEVLAVGDDRRFIVLQYRDFIRFATVANSKHAPDVHSVLDVGGEHAFVVVGFDALRRSLLSLEIIGEIDEQAYLAHHKDVAAAVSRGEPRSAREHYVFQGYFEQRAVRFRSTGTAPTCGST